MKGGDHEFDGMNGIKWVFGVGLNKIGWINFVIESNKIIIICKSKQNPQNTH